MNKKAPSRCFGTIINRQNGVCFVITALKNKQQGEIAKCLFFSYTLYTHQAKLNPPNPTSEKFHQKI